MIQPSIGRVVWYVPFTWERAFSDAQPFAAVVTHVWSEHMVSLAVYREDGSLMIGKTSITLAQDRQAQPGECQWMPY